MPVQREEVRVEREPITEANRDAAMRGPDISEAEHEVTTYEERPVVTNETVPKERVRLEKETVTDTETVGGEVRKEKVDVEGDVKRADPAVTVRRLIIAGMATLFLGAGTAHAQEDETTPPTTVAVTVEEVEVAVKRKTATTPVSGAFSDCSALPDWPGYSAAGRPGTTPRRCRPPGRSRQEPVREPPESETTDPACHLRPSLAGRR